ncbi:restriction endonuclease [Gulosibacter chungangensis]|uniref:Uncharacterized protein n=1 Tax=Gulosibacter chungangensis TaxID=979746 RepID=A0A7J5BBC6_9MICO|nr:hypothetical protein [Gulosibacter chungangensis]KAB1642542.1 hypothetical protein F8O05_08690 [Gulosibacter chungangensis]
MTTVWLVRNDVFDAELEEQSFISIGWDDVPDLSSMSLDTESLVDRLEQTRRDKSVNALRAWAGTLRRFYQEVHEGDVVVAPHSDGTRLRIGHVSGPYFHADGEPTHRHRLPVTWALTDFPRSALPPEAALSLASISTLSRIHQQPELFESLAANPEVARTLMAQEHGDTKDTVQSVWLVNANHGSIDLTKQFVVDGYWNLADGLSGKALQIRPGDRIAVKRQSIRTTDVPFENYGQRVSSMLIKARGTVTAILDDRVLVEWDKDFTPREWFFYTSGVSVW